MFESPRGPMFIDASTRDVVPSVYIRKVERRQGELCNIAFAELKHVRDPPRSK